MKIDTIETSRIQIRNFTLGDAYDLYEILGDKETMKSCEPPYDFEKTKAFLHSFCIDRGGALATVDKQSRKMIGYLLFNELSEDVYEIGWIFHKQYLRKGYAYEASQKLIDYAFRELHVHKIFAETIDSVKSVGLMKKLGMHLEGIQRKQVKDSDGKWADVRFYGILREDYEQMML